MQTKLTLRLDEELIKEVKSIANRQGQSVSKMVAVYINSLREKPDQNKLQLTPLVKTLKGAWRGRTLDRKDYQRYLEKKYL
jgi:predicted transcriptional regulator